MIKSPILVIDDDKDIRESLSEVLVDEGYIVVSASNGKEALEYLKTASPLPCMVFLDLMMPIMDGRSFRKEQLLIPAISDIPTILFSADGQLDKKALDIGIKNFVKKPIDLDELLAIAAKYC